MAPEVTAQVRALAGLSLDNLRLEWRRLYGAPPRLRSPELFAQLLAWRVQSEAAGGLDEATKQALRRKGAVGRSLELQVGTKLAREWRGVRHEVQVVEDGFEYAGERYPSLSEVARLITGSRWSGPRFFGLRE